MTTGASVAGELLAGSKSRKPEWPDFSRSGTWKLSNGSAMRSSQSPSNEQAHFMPFTTADAWRPTGVDPPPLQQQALLQFIRALGIAARTASIQINEQARG